MKLNLGVRTFKECTSKEMADKHQNTVLCMLDIFFKSLRSTAVSCLYKNLHKMELRTKMNIFLLCEKN